jgi:hypothetical protein
VASSGDPDAPNVNITWWGGTAQATYLVEYRLNSGAWQYFYTGSDTTRNWLSMPTGQHSFRVKAKRGTVESPTWTEASLQVGTPPVIATPTPTPNPVVTATPIPTIAPSLAPAPLPSSTTSATKPPVTPSPSATSTGSPSPKPSVQPSAAAVVTATKPVTGFTGKTLSSSAKKTLTALVKSQSAANSVVCTGFYKTSSQLATVKAQAITACAYLKSQDKTLLTSVITAKSAKTTGVVLTFKK